MKTLVVALGGNALLQRGEALTAENQYRNIASAVPALARLARSYRLAIVHGNGPQVGLLALQNLAWKEVEPYPLDVLVAESQGMIGYMLAQSLSAQPQMPPVTTVLTRIEVSPQRSHRVVAQRGACGDLQWRRRCACDGRWGRE
ncbi:hypothetical protein ESCOCP322M2_22040 [Escherichia coli]